MNYFPQSLISQKLKASDDPSGDQMSTRRHLPVARASCPLLRQRPAPAKALGKMPTLLSLVVFCACKIGRYTGQYSVLHCVKRF